MVDRAAPRALDDCSCGYDGNTISFIIAELPHRYARNSVALNVVAI
jgi:hypothetical protein